MNEQIKIVKSVEVAVDKVKTPKAIKKSIKVKKNSPIIAR